MTIAPPPPETEALRSIAQAASRAPTKEVREDDAAMIKREMVWRVTVAAMSPEIEIWHWYYRDRPTRASISAAPQLEGIEFFDFTIANLVKPTRGAATPSQRRESDPVLPTVSPRRSETKWRHGDAIEAPHCTVAGHSASIEWKPCTFLQSLAPTADGDPRYMVRWPTGARTMVNEIRAMNLRKRAA